VVTKIPRFAFEKFPGTDPVLTTQMKSVGEAMAIGRTFQESFQKPCDRWKRGGRAGAAIAAKPCPKPPPCDRGCAPPTPSAFSRSTTPCSWALTIDEIYQLTGIDPWFLHQLAGLLETEKWLKRTPLKP
jgi:carbamoyl-phosphate synthase large subunit